MLYLWKVQQTKVICVSFLFVFFFFAYLQKVQQQKRFAWVFCSFCFLFSCGTKKKKKKRAKWGPNKLCFTVTLNGYRAPQNNHHMIGAKFRFFVFFFSQLYHSKHTKRTSPPPHSTTSHVFCEHWLLLHWLHQRHNIIKIGSWFLKHSPCSVSQERGRGEQRITTGRRLVTR